jgi:hypothetical protein
MSAKAQDFQIVHLPGNPGGEPSGSTMSMAESHRLRSIPSR